MTARARSTEGGPAGERPIAVDVVEKALADWLGSFTAHGDLLGEMAEACAAGAAWPGAIAATATRRAGWSDAEAMAWGVAVGALAGALEGAGRSLAGDERDATATSDGPARPLLAADGLVAAAHETLSSLDPDRLASAYEALESAMGDGGPWRALATGDLRGPAWAALVPLAVTPAAQEVDAGPWAGYAIAWRAAFVEAEAGEPGEPAAERFPDTALWERPDAGEETRALFEQAARAARPPRPSTPTEPNG